MAADRPQHLRLVLLGTGTSGGIPLIGCSCDTCRSEDPRDKRTRTGAALLFTDPGGRERCILIDCTPDLRVQALRHDLRRCDAILFTHHHVDHTFGLDEVRRFNAVMNAPIEVVADRHTMDNLRRVYQHIFDRDANVNKSFVASLIPRTIEAGDRFDLFGLRIRAIRLLHGRLPIVGYRFDFPGDVARASVEKDPADAEAREASGVEEVGGVGGGDPESSHPLLPLAYCTDVSGIPTESWADLDGLSTLVLDGLRHRHHPTHLTIDRAVGVVRECSARRAYLTHIAHEVRHEPTERELPSHIRLGYDGLTLGDGEPGEGPGVMLDHRWMGRAWGGTHGAARGGGGAHDEAQREGGQR
ncbi:MAG: MBL fold metallo-hydrolase [Phycisphaerales bacterium]